MDVDHLDRGELFQRAARGQPRRQPVQPARQGDAPENNTHVWRNPEVPTALNRIALNAVVDPPAPQIIWYVDGEPFAITDPDRTVYWPAAPGEHRFQIRLPLRSGAS